MGLGLWLPALATWFWRLSGSYEAYSRFEDAGKANNFNTTQYLLTVSFLTFMPHRLSVGSIATKLLPCL